MPKYTRSFAPEMELTEDENEAETARLNPPQTAEEQNWKDRYGNLRSYAQRKENELKSKLSDLEKQLEEATRKQIVLPTSPEDVQEWAQRYPDVAKIVETIAIQKSAEQTDVINKRLEEIKARELENDKRAAQLELHQAHPDFFDDIRHREDFHQWLATKSKRTQAAIYENDTDASAAIDVIDLYKAEIGRAKKERPNPRDAARAIDTRSTTRVSTGNEAHFTESQVAAMTAAEYAKHEAAIDKAISEGKFEYDLTGGARF